MYGDPGRRDGSVSATFNAPQQKALGKTTNCFHCPESFSYLLIVLFKNLTASRQNPLKRPAVFATVGTAPQTHHCCDAARATGRIPPCPQPRERSSGGVS
jgi:hypothetical protein